MLLIVQDFMALVPLRVIGHRMNQEREDWTYPWHNVRPPSDVSWLTKAPVTS